MTRSLPKTLIVPGLDGSPAPHWQEWWARTDPNAMMIDMPDPARPVREVWEAAVAAQVLRHPGSILVGHSLGAVTIARLLARWPGLRIRAALLVAPADPARSDRTQRFGPLPRNRFDVPALVVASRNDPWMSFEDTRALAQSWGATLLDMGHVGHINTAAGFGPWPAGKRLRDELLSQTQPASFLSRMFATLGRPAQIGLPA